MNTWILSVAAVCLLTVILDLLIAEGETKKYIRGIMSIIIVFAIIAPLPKLLNKEINIDAYFEDGGKVSADTSYLYKIYVAQYAEKEQKLQKAFETQGVKGAVVNIAIGYDGSFGVEVMNVTIDINNAVITENKGNIDINEMLTATAATMLNVKKERIVIYGKLKE